MFESYPQALPLGRHLIHPKCIHNELEQPQEQMARPSRVQVSASWVWNNIKTQKTSRQSPHDCGCLPANELQTLPWCFTDSQGLWSSLFKLFVPRLNRFSCLEFLFKVLKDTFLLVCLFGLWDQNVVLRSEIVKCSLGWYAERCAWKQVTFDLDVSWLSEVS